MRFVWNPIKNKQWTERILWKTAINWYCIYILFNMYSSVAISSIAEGTNYFALQYIHGLRHLRMALPVASCCSSVGEGAPGRPAWCFWKPPRRHWIKVMHQKVCNCYCCWGCAPTTKNNGCVIGTKCIFLYAPLKMNLEPENHALQKWCSSSRGVFSGFMLIF